MSDFFRTQMGQRFVEGTMPQIAKALERVAGALESRPLSQDEIEKMAAFWTRQIGDVFADANDARDPQGMNEAIGKRVQWCVVQAIQQALEQSRSNVGR